MSAAGWIRLKDKYYNLGVDYVLAKGVKVAAVLARRHQGRPEDRCQGRRVRRLHRDRGNRSGLMRGEETAATCRLLSPPSCP